ncbi:MAG: plasmid recombination protein [Clostridia bacterium]|nr:plasmid recombination protein [Clostridia bacterium]
MEKYKRQEVSPVEDENERDENYQTANPNIDSSRTKDNYHIIYPRQSYIEAINSRLERLELKRKIRSDAIYMNSFVITSDGEFFKDMRAWEQHAFFEDCARFFMDKYGYENVLSAVVHMDETTPHLHLNIVPINDGRLSSKSLFDRWKLAQLQTELWEQVGEKYGLKRGKYGSAAKHVSAAEHRAKKIVEEAEQRGAEIDGQTEKKRTELADLTQTVDAVTEAANKPIPKKKKDVESEIKALRTKTAMQEREIQIRGRDQRDLYTQLQEAKSTESRKETAYKIVTDMMSAYPDEFDALLKKSRDKKAGGGQSSFRKNSGSWSK